MSATSRPAGAEPEIGIPPIECGDAVPSVASVARCFLPRMDAWGPACHRWLDFRHRGFQFPELRMRHQVPERKGRRNKGLGYLKLAVTGIGSIPLFPVALLSDGVKSLRGCRGQGGKNRHRGLFSVEGTFGIRQRCHVFSRPHAGNTNFPRYNFPLYSGSVQLAAGYAAAHGSRFSSLGCARG